MGHYRATRDYQSNHNGRTFGYSEGDECEVDDAVAEWVNRDSPGTLEALDVEDPPTEPEGSSEDGPSDSPEDASSTSEDNDGSEENEPSDDTTCPDCGFEAKTPAGLAAHRRSHEDG